MAKHARSPVADPTDRETTAPNEGRVPESGRRTRWRPRLPRLPRLSVLLGAGIPLFVVVALLATWLIDTAGGDSVRNTTLAGEAVGGKTRRHLEPVVARLTERYQQAKVEISVESNAYETTAGALGLALDQPATLAGVLDIGRDGFVAGRPATWVRSFFADHEAELFFQLDRDQLQKTLIELEGDRRQSPEEPSITAGANGVEVVPGRSGSGIDADAFARTLLRTARSGEIPLAVRGRRTTVAPRFSDADAQKLADQANELTRQPLRVTMGDKTTELSPRTTRSWLRAVAGTDALTLEVDQEVTVESLTRFFPTVDQTPRSATFTVVDGKPVINPSRDGRKCCEADTAQRIMAALTAKATEVEVALVITKPELTTEKAEALGIVEEVGQPNAFGPTTRHACCQPRVENIHRIADIVRGKVIMPGASFSVNGFVGARTTSRGFVPAPVIYEGVFEEDVGGGVSQFATTLFNAAFFAGLSFGEYQSHSIVIDRYPRGREATISYRHPDLVIKNTTPYGVLLWPTYTDTSVTVRLYSTRYVDVEAGPTRDSPHGKCTRVTTPRTRRYVDGRVVTDSVFAIYRPAEGEKCS